VPDVVQQDCAAVGGLTLGADPVAAAMMHASAKTDRPVDAFVVRKAGKAHGLTRLGRLFGRGRK